MKIKTTLALAVFLTSVAACSGDGDSSSSGGTHGGGAGGSSAGGSSGSSGTSGSSGGGAGGSAGSSGSAGTSSSCGNDQIDPGEDCDGLETGGASCESIGLGPGVLHCDAAACGFIAWECSCGGESIPSLPATLNRETVALFSVNSNSSCVSTTAGPSRIYTYQAAQDGMLSVDLSSGDDLSVSIRKSCTLAIGEPSPFSDEIGCTFQGEPKSFPLKAGELVYVIVQARSFSDAPTPFALTLSDG